MDLGFYSELNEEWPNWPSLPIPCVYTFFADVLKMVWAFPHDISKTLSVDGIYFMSLS